ncbi:radical SAM protein [Haliangium ochraceum]|uniref:Radical SAM domain protein n=1 Tax=Haliangium ochraceum (strain DSM 14365 / JCM 11303 / SMP-2) TaxID=502025 RepID=D0LTE2_HALO1|nr:radical SAM protein [Haliangium ochraceum]ACY13837.1 Radical SAM domain protein [Haliangium ochraceum DSM 14365]
MDTATDTTTKPKPKPGRGQVEAAGPALSRFGMVFLTEDCDKTCPHCFNTWDQNMSAGSLRLDCEAARVLLARAAERGLEDVAITGGEPLLHDGAVALVAALSELGLRTVLFTSGTRIDELGEALVQAGLDELRFSFNEFPYAMSDIAFERLWRVFEERITPALRWFRGRLMVNAIASRRSLPLVGELRKRLGALGVDRVKVQPLFVGKDNPWYERLTLHGVPTAEWDAREHDMSTAGAEGQADYLALFRAFYERDERPARCRVAPMLVLGADGQVHPCLNRFDLSVGTLGASEPDELIAAVMKHQDLADAGCFREECLCLFRPRELG